MLDVSVNDVADAVIAGKAAAGEVVAADDFVEVTEPEAEDAPLAEAAEAPADERALADEPPAAEDETAAGDAVKAPSS